MSERRTTRSARRKATWLSAHYGLGRTMPRPVYGRIVGRAKVGLEEEDWRFVTWFAEEMGETIYDILRGAVCRDRESCERDLRAEGISPPWME